jgi:hypothetical protein
MPGNNNALRIDPEQVHEITVVLEDTQIILVRAADNSITIANTV